MYFAWYQSLFISFQIEFEVKILMVVTTFLQPRKNRESNRISVV